MAAPPKEIIEALRRMHLLDGWEPAGERLTGGVSSDIWRIDLPGGPICIKRALPKLRVAADWQAPIERNLYEARWMRVAAEAAPGTTPKLLGQDATTGSLAMEYLAADRYKLWKEQLRTGEVDVSFAAAVGNMLVRIHNATAARKELAAEFPTDTIFFDIRLDPYLGQIGRVYPLLAERMAFLINTTRCHKMAVVHGDVSPKNILCGPDGPVFLDAECAWWGDPAFDLAFCLNHLMLKCLWVSSRRDPLIASFHALAQMYLSSVAWEPPQALETRAAHLLPALLLARVDGKSPVEYIVQETQREIVRRAARSLLADPPSRLADIVLAWRKEIDT